MESAVICNHAAAQMETDEPSQSQNYENSITSSSMCPMGTSPGDHLLPCNGEEFVCVQNANSSDNHQASLSHNPPSGPSHSATTNITAPTYQPTIESNIEIVTTPIDFDFSASNRGPEFDTAPPSIHEQSNSPANESFSLCYENDSASSVQDQEILDSEDDMSVEGGDTIDNGSFNEECDEAIDVHLSCRDDKPVSDIGQTGSDVVQTGSSTSQIDSKTKYVSPTAGGIQVKKKSLSPQITLVRSPYNKRKPLSGHLQDHSTVVDSSSALEEKGSTRSSRKTRSNALLVSKKMSLTSRQRRSARNSRKVGKLENTLPAQTAVTNQVSLTEPEATGTPVTSKLKARRKKRKCVYSVKRRAKRPNHDSSDGKDSGDAKSSAVTNGGRRRRGRPSVKQEEDARTRKFNVVSPQFSDTDEYRRKSKRRRCSELAPVTPTQVTPSQVTLSLPVENSSNIPEKERIDRTGPSSLQSNSKEKNNVGGGDDNEKRSNGEGGTTPGKQTTTPRNKSKSSASNSESGRRSKGRPPLRQHSSSDKSEEGGSPVKKWKCEFCGLGNCIKGLGYLYGPYEVKEEKDSEVARSEGRHDVAIGFTTATVKRVVWVHTACVYWSPGVCLIGDEIMGLDEAVSTAAVTACTVCGNKGAVLCCDVRTCRQCYHYPCAVDQGCKFNVDKFHITCAKHLPLPSSHSDTPPQGTSQLPPPTG